MTAISPTTLTVCALLLLAAPARAQGEDVALLASATVGDERVLPVAAHGDVASVVSFALARVPAEAASALSLPEVDRAALLRAENALSRMGAPAVEALAALLPQVRGARAQVVARALGRSCERLAKAASKGTERDKEAVRRGAAALVAHPATLVSEHLLFSGKTTTPELDPELLPELLGALAPLSLGALADVGAKPDGFALACRALAHAKPAANEAAKVLGELLARATSAGERTRAGEALGELAAEGSVEPLEKALLEGPLDEARERIVEIEATREPRWAPRALVKALPRLPADEQARAFEAIIVCAIPPPPAPKIRFVVDPYARRRARFAREARDMGREAALAHVVEGPLTVRRAAARVLAALGRPDAVKDQQAVASRLLAAFERETALAVLGEEARALAALAPQEIVAPAFRRALARVLDGHDDDGEARDRLVHAVLYVLGDEEADLAPLERVVADAALEPAARARAAALLAKQGATGRARLDALARSDDAIARACAKAARAGALAQDQVDLSYESGELGRSPHAFERRAGVAILAYAEGRLAQGAVQSIARNDRSPLVRLEGTLALARVYGKPAAGVLAQALFDAAPDVRREAARALARLDEPNVAGSLCQAIARAKKLPDPDEAASEERTLRAALAGLGKDAVPSVGNIALNSGDPLERRVALAQLGRIATDEAIAYLMVAARGPKTAEDRDAAAWALERATGRDLTDSMWQPLRPIAR